MHKNQIDLVHKQAFLSPFCPSFDKNAYLLLFFRHLYSDAFKNLMLLSHKKLPSLVLVFYKLLVFYHLVDSDNRLLAVSQAIHWYYLFHIWLHKIFSAEQRHQAFLFQLRNRRLVCTHVFFMQFFLRFNLSFDWISNFVLWNKLFRACFCSLIFDFL